MDTITRRVIDLAIQIQQIAAPTFHEQERAKFVCKLFEEEGLKDVVIDETGNVYGRWTVDDGQRTEAKPLIISAHLDTVFPFDMDLSAKREDDRVFGIGIGDNSLGVTALFGLMWMLRDRLPSSRFDYASSPRSARGDIWFVANTGEEGLGDLRDQVRGRSFWF